MHFRLIELFNFGIYKGLHRIELQKRTGERNITLIGGMNGRGKTTILDAVFLCLYGRKAAGYVSGVGQRTAMSSGAASASPRMRGAPP